jgi:hypothetical protein
MTIFNTAEVAERLSGNSNAVYEEQPATDELLAQVTVDATVAAPTYTTIYQLDNERVNATIYSVTVSWAAGTTATPAEFRVHFGSETVPSDDTTAFTPVIQMDGTAAKLHQTSGYGLVNFLQLDNLGWGLVDTGGALSLEMVTAGDAGSKLNVNVFGRRIEQQG